MKKRLNKEKQCNKCPWKISTNPYDIPNGYSVEKHKNLKNTIKEGLYFSRERRVMACHETDDDYCIGWLFNQLENNNIGLRISMLEFDLSRVELDGEQHKSFEDTLPKGDFS